MGFFGYNLKINTEGPHMAKKPIKKKKPVGRPKTMFTEEMLLKLIDSDQINPSIGNLAMVLGCSTNPLRRYIKEHPIIQEAIDLRWDKLKDKSYEVWEEILDGNDVKAKESLSKWIMKHTNPLFKDQPLDVNMDGQITINIKRAEED